MLKEYVQGANRFGYMLDVLALISKKQREQMSIIFQCTAITLSPSLSLSLSLSLSPK